MKQEQTASQIRYDACNQAAVFDRLMKHPHLQAEAIARHYIAHARLASDILEMVTSREVAPISDDVDSLIESMVNTIRNRHRKDLGIELEWKPETQPRGDSVWK